MFGIFGNLIGGHRTATPTYAPPAGGYPVPGGAPTMQTQDRMSSMGYAPPIGGGTGGYSGPGAGIYNLAGFGARGLGLLFNRIFGNSAPTTTAAAAPAGAAPPLGTAPSGSGNITSVNPISNYDRGRMPWQSGLSAFGRITTQDVRSKNIA